MSPFTELSGELKAAFRTIHHRIAVLFHLNYSLRVFVGSQVFNDIANLVNKRFSHPTTRVGNFSRETLITRQTRLDLPQD